MTIVFVIATAMLATAAALSLLRLYRGPTSLDRILSVDVLLVILIAAIALESVWNRHATNLPLIMILAMVNFVGGVAVTRLMSHDAESDAVTGPDWDADTDVNENGNSS